MKDDLGPMPARPPRKRRQLEDAPDVWLAMWAADGSLTPSERRRVEGARDARRASRGREDVRVAVAVPVEGVEPQQMAPLVGAVSALRPTEIVHPLLPSRVYQSLRPLGAAMTMVRSDADAVAGADALVAVSKDRTPQPYKTPGVWSVVGYARHRRVPARVVMPDGTIEERKGQD